MTGSQKAGNMQATIGLERLSWSIRDDTAALAGLAAEVDESCRVPTCPGWTFRQLVTHVGRAQRWAATIVERRSAEFIAFRDVPDGKLPADPESRPGWLNAGARQLIEAISDGADERVWTTIGMGPGSFWARRMAHETTVHLADAQLAVGRDVGRDPDVAADGVDEWLGLLARGAPSLRGDGQTLHFHATDEGLDGRGEWLARRTPAGVTVDRGHARADVAVRGSAGRLLFVLTRRLPASDPEVEVLGDAALLAHWLGHTPY
jgi:uncharacterized protein (TIGR03083 family)